MPSFLEQNGACAEGGGSLGLLLLLLRRRRRRRQRYLSFLVPLSRTRSLPPSSRLLRRSFPAQLWQGTPTHNQPHQPFPVPFRLPAGISHLAFFPLADRLVLAAGDKDGHVGVWDVTRPPHDDEERGEEDSEVDAARAPAGGGASDGVLLFRPHGQYVSGLVPCRGRLFTSSYDGTVRCLDPAGGVFAEVRRSCGPGGREFSAMDVSEGVGGLALLLGDNQGGLTRLDARDPASSSPSSPSPSCEFDGLHHKKINTVSVDPERGHLFATSSTDGDVSVWDLRRLSLAGPTPVARLAHAKSCQAAYWSPAGCGARRLLTTCYDDRLRVWDDPSSSSSDPGPPPSPTLSIRHDHNTGRWVLPFRAAWSPAGDGILCGSMTRQVGLFGAGPGSSGETLAAHQSGYLTAIPSRVAAHPEMPAVAGATASGRVAVFR